MRRQTLLLRFEPQATPPAGDPPSFDVKSGPGTVTLLEGDDDGVPTEASYETHVTMTGETTFLEDGGMTVDGGGLRLETVGTGTIEPSPEEGTLRGAVVPLLDDEVAPRRGDRGAQVDVAAARLHPGEHDVLGQHPLERGRVRRVEAHRHDRQLDGALRSLTHGAQTRPGSELVRLRTHGWTT